jgi:hypothetical protein
MTVGNSFIRQGIPITGHGFVPMGMPILKPFGDKAFREKIKKQVYENEHLLCDIVRGWLLSLIYELLLPYTGSTEV